MTRTAFLALALAALAPLMSATAQRGIAPVPHPTPIAPVPVMPVPITQMPITPTPTPIAPLPTPTPITPIPVAPSPVIIPRPPPPACRVRTTSECAREAVSCLTAHYVADRYSVQWVENWPRATPNPDNRSDAAEQAADDCANNLRQCLVGC